MQQVGTWDLTATGKRERGRMWGAGQLPGCWVRCLSAFTLLQG